MRPIRITGLVIVAALAMSAFSAPAASATNLTLSDRGVALAAGNTLEVYGRRNLFVATPVGNIECNENNSLDEGAGLSLELVTNTKPIDQLRVITGIGVFAQEPDCRTNSGFGNSTIALDSPGILRLTSAGKATEGPVVFFIRFEREAQECQFKGSLAGAVNVTPSREPIQIELGGRLTLDKSFANSRPCPTKADLSVSFPFTRNQEEEENRIEEQTGTPPPSVTSVAPDVGPKAGGTSVRLTGSNFVGATSVKFGSASATSFTVRSASSIAAVSPAGAGPVDVTVTTPAGTSPTGPADRFSYGPTITNVNPSSGPASGGTSVTITGTSLSGTTEVQFGSTSATSFTVNSPTSITAVSPNGTGTVDVTATTSEGMSPTTSADQFIYVPSPTVRTVSPSVGPETGGVSVTVRGTNLMGATSVRFGSASATSFAVDSTTEITALAPAGTGTVDVTVTTVGGTSGTGAGDEFNYLPPPSVANVNPNTGLAEGGTSVTISGTSFTGATEVSFGAMPATSFTVNSAMSITAIAPPGVGAVDVTVTTPGGRSPTGSADVFSYLPRPAVLRVRPARGPATGGTVVTITGANLTGATAVRFGASAATGFTVSSSSSVTATSPTESVGTVDVTVTTPNGTSATSSSDHFTFTPTVANLSPSAGSTTGGTSVTVTGAGFVPGSGGTRFTFGTTTSKSVNCTSTMECTVVSPAHAAGPVDVKATVNKVSSPRSAPADQFTYE